MLKFRVNPNISDDGMSLISSELQYNNILIELSVPVCGLTAKGSLRGGWMCFKCHLALIALRINLVFHMTLNSHNAKLKNNGR